MAYRSFRDDEQIAKKLDEIPKNEMSTIIRMALRAWFKIDTSKPPDPITPEVARMIAQELMQEQKKKAPPPK